MTTTITMLGPAGRASVTVTESVGEVVDQVNAALLRAGPQFVIFSNTSDQQVGIRADSIQGVFEDDGLEVSIGRAGVGAAMMQMNRRASIDSPPGG